MNECEVSFSIELIRNSVYCSKVVECASKVVLSVLSQTLYSIISLDLNFLIYYEILNMNLDKLMTITLPVH